MSIAALLQMFKSIARAAFQNRNKPDKWEGWVEVVDDEDMQKTSLNGKFTKVKVEMSGLLFEVTVGGKKVVLEGRPSLSNHLEVYLNNVIDPEARIVVKSKATVKSPLRTGIDVRPVTFEGNECRFNLRFKG